MHFLSFSHLKVESLWQALGMTVPGLEREQEDMCSSGCHPVSLERRTLSCASGPQKAVWLSLYLGAAHICSVHGSPDLKASSWFQLKPPKQAVSWFCMLRC